MDSSRKKKPEEKYDGSSANDGERIGPAKTLNAASLRPSISRGSVQSPYSDLKKLLEMDGHDKDLDSEIEHGERSFSGNRNGSHRNSLKQAPDSLSRSASTSFATAPAFSHTPNAASYPGSVHSVASSKGSSIYGTKNTKGSLEDDDPYDSAANVIDHLTMSSSSVSANSFPLNSGRRMMSATGGMPRSMGIGDDGILNGDGHNANSSRRMSNISRGQQNHASSGSSFRRQPQSLSHLPPSASAASSFAQTRLESDLRKAPPKNDDDYNYDNEQSEQKVSAIDSNGREATEDDLILTRNHSVAMSSASNNQDDFIALAKEQTKELLLSASSVISSKDEEDINADYIENLMEYCKKYQAMLEEKLSDFFQENSDATETDHVVELLTLSDEIASAIDAGNEALKCEEERTKKKMAAEGPTIELLKANRDVFSLICMLRAASEKRMLAALALMKFAKEDQVLRNEIISSGGIHSFLTLAERGITRELKVVASLAVAYILPSYVASSQTTSAIGLKLVECLHFLATSNPVSPNGVVITVEEMCKAASVGVNFLWINSIQPLIAMKKVKDECSSSPPSLRPGKSVRYGRLRSRTG